MNSKKENKIWYAAYGTNLNKDRFLCYINGGTPEGTHKFDIGCHDKSFPLDGGRISIPFQLYFAGSIPKWGGKGVGFLNSKLRSTTNTLGRKYLVSDEQFKDIFKQANNIDPEGMVDINFEKIRHNGVLTIVKSWYGRVIFLGEEGGSPIFTLTSYQDFESKHTNAPAEKYLKHIVKGIKQTYILSNEQILEYLYEKPGVSKIFLKNALLSLIQEV